MAHTNERAPFTAVRLGTFTSIRDREGITIANVDGQDAPMVLTRLNHHAELVELADKVIRESMIRFHGMRRCINDELNPCWDNRSTDIIGKHWGGGESCSLCDARALLARIDKKAGQ